MLDEFSELFANLSGLPLIREIDHAIVLKEGTSPISIQPYLYPQVLKDEIEQLIVEMLVVGIIQPNNSPFSSLVLLVKKKDGSWRFCVDYRALNQAKVPGKFPIPIMEELLNELHGLLFLAKLTSNWGIIILGYHHIRIRTEDVPETAFWTHTDHYEFLVMPFGLTNAPSTFQSLMNDIFRKFLREFVLVFFDDILIYSATTAAHVEHL